jgi:hypothetical protein
VEVKAQASMEVRRRVEVVARPVVRSQAVRVVEGANTTANQRTKVELCRMQWKRNQRVNGGQRREDNRHNRASSSLLQ